VSNQTGNSVSIINTTTATPTVIATIALPSGAAPNSVVLSTDGSVAYVANSNDTISVVDLTAATPTLLRTIAADPTPEYGAHALALSADGTRLYLIDTADNTLRSASLTTPPGSITPPPEDDPSSQGSTALDDTV
jgi:DNA-binding beta-propeller fold protein YncE